MSREQRMRVDAMVRRPIPTGPHPIEEMRAGFAALMAMMCVPEQVRSSPVTLGGRPGVLVESEQAGRPGTILYFHGGSFTLGSPETAMSLTANLVVRTGMRAFSLDYRLAPEHPFPAGLEDALAAYRDLLDAGNDPESIAFAGDSAGGGIAVGTCLMARDAAGQPEVDERDVSGQAGSPSAAAVTGRLRRHDRPSSPAAAGWHQRCSSTRGRGGRAGRRGLSCGSGSVV